MNKCDEKGVCIGIPTLKSQVETKLGETLNFIKIEKSGGDIYIFGKSSTNIDKTASTSGQAEGSTAGYFGSPGTAEKTGTTADENVADEQPEGEETAGLFGTWWSKSREKVREFFWGDSKFGDDAVVGVKG